MSKHIITSYKKLEAEINADISAVEDRCSARTIGRLNESVIRSCKKNRSGYIRIGQPGVARAYKYAASGTILDITWATRRGQKYVKWDVRRLPCNNGIPDEQYLYRKNPVGSEAMWRLFPERRQAARKKQAERHGLTYTFHIDDMKSYKAKDGAYLAILPRHLNYPTLIAGGQRYDLPLRFKPRGEKTSKFYRENEHRLVEAACFFLFGTEDIKAAITMNVLKNTG